MCYEFPQGFREKLSTFIVLTLNLSKNIEHAGVPHK